jgi:hypothetical protein
MFLLPDRAAVTRGFFRRGQRGAQLRQALERNIADQPPRHAGPIKFSESTRSRVRNSMPALTGGDMFS